MSYDTIWKNEQSPQHYKATFPEELLELFKKEKIKKVLDLGSGSGENMVLLAKQGFEVYGMEWSTVGVEKTKALAKKEKVNVHVRQGDMYNPFSFPDSSFDAVYGLQSLNHNTQVKIIMLFKEINRILKKDGIFALKIADRESYNLKEIKDDVYLDEDFNEKFKFLDEQTYIPLDGGEKGITHYAFFKDQLEKEVSKQGFALMSSKKVKWHILAYFRKQHR